MVSQETTNELLEFFKQHKQFRYKKRDMILHANDSSSSVFFIENGYIRVFRISEQGEELTLTILRPNDLFPLTYGLKTTPNPYYLEAITPLELRRAPQEQFLDFIRSDSDVYFDLTNKMLIRLDGVLTRMEYLIFSNAYTKIAATLLICAKRFGEQHDREVVLKVPLTHKDIATLVGITRETTSLEMKKLEHEGYIGKQGKLLIIKDVKRLEEEVLLINGEDAPFDYSL